MSEKVKYRIRNWSKYNEALINRGRVTFWFSEDEQESWLSHKLVEGKGRPELYSNIAIQCMLIIRKVYSLPLRGMQGFVESLIELSKLSLPCPNYTTVCKRAKSVNIKLPKAIKPGEAINVLVDSSGLKIYGEGEWKVRKHGISKRRTWRKLHIAICAETQSIVGFVMTENNVADCEAFSPLIDSISEPIKNVYGDGGYDTEGCYKTCNDRGANPIIPPRDGAIKHEENANLASRNIAIDRIASLGGGESGSKKWKQEIGYHERSLVETQFFRIKTIFGSSLRSRKIENQVVECAAICAALNKMTSLGMPESYAIAS